MPRQGASQQPTGHQGGEYRQVPEQHLRRTAPLEIQHTITDLDEFETVAEWAHTRAMSQGQPEVAKLTDHLAEVARLQKQLVLGQSPFARTLAQCTEQCIQQGIQQLQPYTGEPTVQEVIQEGQRVSRTIGQAQGQFQGWSQQSMQGGQPVQQGGQPLRQGGQHAQQGQPPAASVGSQQY